MGIFRRFFGDDSEDPYARMRRMREREAEKARGETEFYPGKMFYVTRPRDADGYSVSTCGIVSSNTSQMLIIPEVW
jgi:hypothetical protein